MNNFELMGKLNWSEIKHTESGKVITRALIAEKKKGTDNWQSFPITVFNTKDRNTAEDFANVKKGAYVKVTGKLDINSWIDKTTGKEVNRTELIVFNFTEMVFDENQNKFVPKTTNNSVDNDEIPF